MDIYIPSAVRGLITCSSVQGMELSEDFSAVRGLINVALYKEWSYLKILLTLA